jgi:methyl-accepting chemotaxis protein
MKGSWLAFGPLIALSLSAFLVGGCAMNPIERSVGAVEAMGANTGIMAANTGALSQNTRSMAVNTAQMADSTRRMSQMTDRMAKSTEGMSEATKRMAEATEKMERNTGALSKGVAPLLSAEEHLEDKRLRLKQVIQRYREECKQVPHLWEKLKQELRQEFEK